MSNPVREDLEELKTKRGMTLEERVEDIPAVRAYRVWQDKWVADGWSGLRECKDHADALIDALYDALQSGGSNASK